MHTSKTAILALLKRNGGHSVDELASALSLAPMTVRQHLATLERDALVQAATVRNLGGRPHYRYGLTEEGHRSVARGHDRLLALLLETLAPPYAVSDGDDDGDRRTRLFRRAAGALADRHCAEVQALPARERPERAATILRAYGGFAEWHDLGGTVEVRDFNCVFRDTVRKDGACEWHETFLSRVLAADVRTAGEAAGGAACCSYIIGAGAGTPAANRGQYR